MRKCVHCGQEISLATMIKGRWKATFCSADCRVLDKNAVRAAKKAYRAAHGQCPACGRKRSNAREQTQITTIPMEVHIA